MKRVEPYSYSFTEEEFNKANDVWGANCGPGAIATMLGLKIDDVRTHIPDFDNRHYTNPTMMQKALRSLGVKFIEMDDAKDREGVITPRLPEYGLVRVQWEGPWLKPGVPKAASYCYTHWIGSLQRGAETFVFDINGGWRGQADWADQIVPSITSMYKRASGGWYPTHRWELELQ